VVIMIITLMGGRVIPYFTDNKLREPARGAGKPSNGWYRPPLW